MFRLDKQQVIDATRAVSAAPPFGFLPARSACTHPPSTATLGGQRRAPQRSLMRARMPCACLALLPSPEARRFLLSAPPPAGATPCAASTASFPLRAAPYRPPQKGLPPSLPPSLLVDPSQGNAARYINHSCEPNCYTWVLVDMYTGVRAGRQARRNNCIVHVLQQGGSVGRNRFVACPPPPPPASTPLPWMPALTHPPCPPLAPRKVPPGSSAGRCRSCLACLPRQSTNLGQSNSRRYAPLTPSGCARQEVDRHFCEARRRRGGGAVVRLQGGCWKDGVRAMLAAQYLAAGHDYKVGAVFKLQMQMGNWTGYWACPWACPTLGPAFLVRLSVPPLLPIPSPPACLPPPPVVPSRWSANQTARQSPATAARAAAPSA